MGKKKEYMKIRAQPWLRKPLGLTPVELHSLYYCWP
jgi:hypothetical protein